MVNWLTRTLGFPSSPSTWTDPPGELLPATRAAVGLSGINDPNTTIYQALTNLMDGGFGGNPELPSITARSSLGISAMYRAVRLISGAISNLPFVVTELQGDGARVVVRDEKDRVVWGRPNPEVTRAVFWRTVLAHFILHGNAYIHVERGGLNQPVEMWPINPTRVSVGRSSLAKGRKKVYVLDGVHDIPYVDYQQGGSIIHVPGLSLDGVKGIGAVDAVRLELQLARSITEYGAAVFANGGLPGGYIATDADLSTEEADKLIAYWMKRHGGLKKAGRPGVLDNGGKWVETNITLEQAQFLASKSMSVMDVARATGAPPHLLFESKGSTSWGTGLIEQTQGFVVFTLNDYSTPFEEAISDALLSPADREAHWNYNKMLRGTPMQRAQRWQVMRNIGAMSVREIRREEELEELTDDEIAALAQPLASNMAPGGGGDEDAAVAALAEISPAAEPAAQALNGAQIASLLTVLQQVTAGQLSATVAKSILEVAFPSIDEALRNQMVDDAAAFAPEKDGEEEDGNDE